jgi:ferredoxin-NADP reductase
LAAVARLDSLGIDVPLDHLPGQYLNLRLTVDGMPVNRSYTIACSPTRRGYVELTVRRERWACRRATARRSAVRLTVRPMASL